MVDVGRDVTRVAVGDLVAVEPSLPCGSCPPCVDGNYNLCLQFLCNGLGGPSGGLSEFTIARESMAYPLPEQVGPVLGALVEPMSVAYRAVLRAHPRPGLAAVVLGAGPIGIGSFLALRALGVDNVTMVEPAPQRRAAVSALGAAAVLDPTATDVVGAIREATHGAGVPVVIDAAGTRASFATGLGVAGRKGRFVTVAAYMEPVTYNPTDVLMREVEIVSSFAYAGEFAAVIEHMAAGRYPAEGWIEHVPFEEHFTAYDRLHRGEAIKLMVDL